MSEPEGPAGGEPDDGAPDPTRPRAGAGEATRVRRAPAIEPTRLKPADPGSPPRGVEPTARRTAASAPRDTGSNWEHPEQWESRHAAGVGPGSVIKQRFLLESVLGQGGMGVVYRALDRRKQEAQDRDPYVAVKILSEEFRRHPQALIALQREARKAQDLAHPNVITVHDFDRDGTTVYMTMELLDGEPLNRVIAAHKLRGLPRERALPLIRGMAEALAYAHRKGIVHSDFKPGNVFVTRNDDVKVLDFGIARAVPTQLRPDADRTVFDAAELGALTPPYASPEMLAGEAPVPADDVFALGIVCHELLTGRHPFDKRPADEARAKGLRPPGVAALPRRQRRTLARALAFERAARQPDAGAFLRELSGPSPLRKAAYGAVVVVLAAAAAYGLYSGSQLRPDVPFASLPAEAQRSFAAAIEEGDRALGFGDVALNDAFEFFARAYDIHRNNPEAIRGLERVADRFLISMAAADTGVKQNVLRKLYCQEYLGTYRPVRNACEDVIGQCTLASMGCPRTESDP